MQSDLFQLTNRLALSSDVGIPMNVPCGRGGETLGYRDQASIFWTRGDDSGLKLPRTRSYVLRKRRPLLKILERASSKPASLHSP